MTGLEIVLLAIIGAAGCAALSRWGVQRHRQHPHYEKQVLDGMVENVLLFDPDLNILYMNQAVRLNLIRSADEGANCYERLFQQSVSCRPCPVEKCIRLGIPQQIELHLKNDRSYRIYARPVFGQNGEVCSAVATIMDITDFGLIQRKLQEDYNQYNEVFNAIEDGLFSYYLDGQNVTCSPAFIRILGMNERLDSVFFENWMDMLSPEGRVDFLKALDVLSSETPAFSVECRAKNYAGRKMWVSIRGRCPKFSVTGKPERLIGLMSDITNRKENELELHKKNSLLQALIENMPIGVFAKDVEQESRFFLWNRHMHEYSGKAATETLGHTDAEIYGHKDAARHQKSDFEVMQTRAALKPIVDELMDVDGQKRYVQITKAPIFDHDSKVAAILGLVVDVTDRVRVVETLRESEARFRNFLDVTPVGICQTTREGDQLIYANPAATRMFGFSSFEEFSTHSEKYGNLFKAMPELREQLLNSFRQSGRNWSAHDLELVRADGESFHAHLIIVIRDDPPPGRQTFFTFIEDTSETIRAEQENTKLRRDLEHLARVNTLGQLAASIAHEINQPLAAIMSNAQAALRFIKNDQEHTDINNIREIFEDIARDDRRAGDVIARLREMLKRKAIHMMPVCINEIIEGVRELIQPDLNRRGIELKIDMPTGLPNVYGDRIQLQQVLLNLCTNGAEAMDRNPPNLKILTVTCEHRNPFVVLHVSDTGPGISPEQADMVFEPFYSTKKSGLGMGLAICQTIIRSIGGTLMLDPTWHDGARFSLRLPTHNEDQ